MAVTQKVITALTKQGGALLAALRESFPFSIVLASGKTITAPGGFVGPVTGVASSATTLTGLTASIAELNYNDITAAGTAQASKTAVLGANKNLDTLVIADGGLKLGSGAGTAITSTAAELNNLASVAAGTVTASKALVVGADKNVDTLAIADGGLKLGSGAGTAVSATAAEINALDAAPTGAPAFTIGAESGGDVIRVTVQLKDANGTNIAARVNVRCWLSNSSGGAMGTAPVAIAVGAIAGTIIIQDSAGQPFFEMLSDANGQFDFDITQTGAFTTYLVIGLPNGKIASSTAITFAA